MALIIAHQEPIVVDMTGNDLAQQAIEAPAAGLAIRVYGVALTPNDDCTVQFQDGDTNELGLLRLTKGIVMGPGSSYLDSGFGWLPTCAEATGLYIILTGAVLLDGVLRYAWVQV